MRVPTWGLPFTVLAFATAVSTAAATPRPDPQPAAAVAFDPEDCTTCHEDAVTRFQTTAHAGLVQSCAACHGSVTEHVRSNLEKDEPGPIVAFSKLTAEEVNETCLGCHDKGPQANWTGGAHERRGVACNSCHSVHAFRSDRKQLQTTRDSEVCFKCHQPIRAKSLRVSHHPVREGVMGCSSCHDAHDGTRPKMVKGEWVNELCLSCHTEKRGPFLWEHAPVRENCLSCHDAHGSNHERLLVAKQPYLCQRCHLNTRHPGTLYDFNTTLAGPRVSNRAVEHACRNCHQAIHGGNGPSGPYLGR